MKNMKTRSVFFIYREIFVRGDERYEVLDAIISDVLNLKQNTQRNYTTRNMQINSFGYFFILM